jgi:hypothetical protein
MVRAVAKAAALPVDSAGNDHDRADAQMTRDASQRTLRTIVEKRPDLAEMMGGMPAGGGMPGVHKATQEDKRVLRLGGRAGKILGSAP